MAKRTFEELVRLKQEGSIGWLEFVQEGDSADEYAQWCKDHNMEQTEDNAELFVDMTEERFWEREKEQVPENV